jgi:hypothetical protein
MDSLTAFALGATHRDEPSRVFDWDKAARLIRDIKPDRAGAGLADDWEWTGGDIYANGRPVEKADTYTYLCSTWATPELRLDGELQDCWKYVKDTDGWNASTYWPQSALDILNGISE